MKKDYTALETKIGHTFADKALLEKALTHPSFRYENDHIDTDNQRLEYLGDAVLGLLSADFLFVRFPDYQEGELTQQRSALTKSQTLADIARKIDIGSWLFLGRGETTSGGSTRNSNLTDVLESVVGAIYLDAGLPAARAFFMRHFAAQLDELLSKPAINNPKGFLQTMATREWKTIPEYELLNTEGPSHSPVYTCQVAINKEVCGEGRASSIRQAQALAAKMAIDKLTAQPPEL